MSNGNELARRDQGQVASSGEQTRPDMAYTPAVDIYETPDELVLLVDLPGVSKDDLSINLDNNVLTIEGLVKAESGEDENALLNEYRTGRYWRQFTLNEAVDQSKVEAKISNGELRLTLPKSEAAKPRRIEVQAA
jgi:HSP20 family protein